MKAPLSCDDLQPLHQFITARTGLLFTEDRLNLIVPVCQELLVEAGLANLAALHQQLQTDHALLDTLLSRITIPESYFFRDPEHFDFIQQVVLPERQLIAPGKPLTLWSAGCAGGEEAYSLAILMEQAGWANERYQILASDISRRALQKARKGHYSAWSLRGSKAQQLQTEVLQRKSKQLVVPARFVQRVNFFYFNLASPDYQQHSALSDIDVILCRNVFIYFSADTIAHISRQLYASLAEGGYLILGPSDPLISQHAPFDVIKTAHGLVYRKPGAAQSNIRRAQSPGLQPTQPALTLKKQQAKPAATAKKAPTQPALQHKPGQTKPVQADTAAAGEPDLIAALYQQALSYFAQGAYEPALTHLRQLLYLDNQLAEVHFTAALTLLKLSQLQQAQRHLRQALSLAGNVHAEHSLPLVPSETAGQLALAARRLLGELQDKVTT